MAAAKSVPMSDDHLVWLEDPPLHVSKKRKAPFSLRDKEQQAKKLKELEEKAIKLQVVRAKRKICHSKQAKIALRFQSENRQLPTSPHHLGAFDTICAQLGIELWDKLLPERHLWNLVAEYIEHQPGTWLIRCESGCGNNYAALAVLCATSHWVSKFSLRYHVKSNIHVDLAPSVDFPAGTTPQPAFVRRDMITATEAAPAAVAWEVQKWQTEAQNPKSTRSTHLQLESDKTEPKKSQKQLREEAVRAALISSGKLPRPPLPVVRWWAEGPKNVWYEPYDEKRHGTILSIRKYTVN